MDQHNPFELLLNKAEASQEIELTEDPAVRKILEMAQWQVHRVFFGFVGDNMSDEERLKLLPTQPFDMLFYIQSVKRLPTVGKGSIVAILSGDIEAGDWF